MKKYLIILSLLISLLMLQTVSAITTTIVSPTAGWNSNYNILLNVTTDYSGNVTFNTSAFATLTTLYTNTTQGNITLNSTFLSEGNNTIYVFGTNSTNSSDTNNPSVSNVAVDVSVPTFDEILNSQTIELGTSFSFDVNASDAGIGIDTYAVNDTTNFAVDGAGIVTNASPLSLGTIDINISVNDSLGFVNSSVITVTVSDTTAPTWDQALTNRAVEYGNGISYDTNASDADTIIYHVNDTTNFAISGTGVLTNATALALNAIHNLNITANDTSDNPVSSIITVTVSDTTAPTFDEALTNQVVDETSSFSYDVNGSDVDTVTYHVNDTTNFAISGAGVITNATPLTPATVYGLNVTLNDSSDNPASSVITVTVNDVTTPTWDTVPADQSITTGDSFGYDVNATDNVAISMYFINDTANFSINSTNGTITSNALLAAGIYNLNISVNDTSDNVLSALITITVSTPPSSSGSSGGGGSKKYECNDNKDNDGDGLIDYPDDPDCSGRYDSEAGTAETKEKIPLLPAQPKEEPEEAAETIQEIVSEPEEPIQEQITGAAVVEDDESFGNTWVAWVAGIIMATALIFGIVFKSKK